MYKFFGASVLGLSLMVMGMGIQQADAAVVLYDSVTPVGDVEAVETLVKKDSWIQIDKGAAATAFKGDAVLVNSKLAAVVRKDGSGVDLFAKGEKGWTRRSRALALLKGQPVTWGAPKLVFGDSVEIEVKVEAAKASIRFGLAMTHPIMKATAVAANVPLAMRMLAPCRFGVLPDFFASDLMVDARLIPIKQAEIPSEKVLLHMVGNGGAIVAALWDKNEQDIRINFDGEGEQRQITGTDIFFGTGGGSICTAILEKPGIWHTKNFVREEETKKKGVMISEWEVPFNGKWKGNFTREDKRIESMVFSNEKPGGLTKKNKERKLRVVVGILSRTEIEFGTGDPKGHLKDRYVALVGPAVFYPSRRNGGTPLDQLCVDDLLRECLGSGPCQSVLDMEGRKTSSKGIFTCSYRRAIGHYFGARPLRQHEIAARIKEERYFVRRLNRNMLTFVRNVQDRINIYVNFGDEMLKFVDAEAKKEPKLADFAKRVRVEWDRPVFILHAKKDNYMISKNEKEALVLVKDFELATKLDTPEQARKGYLTAHHIAGGIGENGDSRLRNLRRKVSVIRGMASMEMAMNPAASKVAKEIRERTQKALRNPHSYEKPTMW